MDDVQIFEQEIINEGKCVGKIVILVGGLNQDKPFRCSCTAAP